MQSVLVDDNDLAGLDLPYQICADGVQGATLGGKYPAGIPPTNAQGAHAQRVTHADELPVGQDNQAVGPGQLWHCVLNLTHTIVAVGFSDQASYDFRVAGG